jgi:cystathionine beta-lyase/cystathionine gamma-synthase
MERLKTLPTRMKKHTENATLVAEALEDFGSIAKVHFPGFSGVVAVHFRDSKVAKQFLKKVHIPKAQSYGGKVTRIQHPTTMMNSNLDEEMKGKIGLNDRLVRIGVGLEPVDEIIEKLTAAL